VVANPCGELPLTGPDGPLGVITLKKIADDTYEQYGTIDFTTQVTISGPVDPGVGTIETTITLREDFISRVNLTATSSCWSFGSGAWGMPKEATPSSSVTTVATISGAVRIVGTGTNPGSLSFSRDEISFTPKMNSNVDRNPTYFVRWAQFGTGAATRSIGWADEALASQSANGLFWRHTNAGVIEAVARSAGVETTLSSSTNAANGVYHMARMVITLHGVAVQCLLDSTDIGTISSNIPTVDLMPTCGTSAASNTNGLDVDYFAMNEDRVVT
jgi:hypothetical protein